MCWKNIYEERGYRARDIPQRFWWPHFGLDIDNRAAQLSGFTIINDGPSG